MEEGMQVTHKKEADSGFGRFLKSEFFHNYTHSGTAILGTVIVVLMVLFALLGPLIVSQNPYDAKTLQLSNAYKPPVWIEGGSDEFLLGTDGQGRDMLSTIAYGSRISLYIGVVGTVLSALLGVFLGLVSGYYGGIIDTLVMRLADVLLSFPTMLIALFMMAIFGRGIDKIILVFTVLGSVTYIRTVRAEVLSVKKKEYVSAARVIGVPNLVIMLRHVLPNVATTIIVLSTMKVGNLILQEATLSFLGVGVPITRPSLGMLVNNGFDVMFSGYWWVAMMPGLYIMLIVFGINLLGDFLRDELNPRLK